MGKLKFIFHPYFFYLYSYDVSFYFFLIFKLMDSRANIFTLWRSKEN